MEPNFDKYSHEYQFLKSKFFFELAFIARKRIFNFFMKVIQPTEKDMILDLGVSPESHDKAINFFESLFPWPKNITAVSISDCSYLEKKFPGLSFVKVQDIKLPFKDNQFDVAFSNAVIEHVGSREKQEIFANEITRVAQKVFVTTPNRWYPIEFHTRLPLTHWLPTNIYRKLWKKIGMGEWANEENLNLLDRRTLIKLFEPFNMNYDHIRFLGFISNLMIWRN